MIEPRPPYLFSTETVEARISSLPRTAKLIHEKKRVGEPSTAFPRLQKTEREILRRHALRNALLPIITLVGLSFPALLTGAFFIERIFAWPGMGYAVINAIATRDYPLVVGGVIIGSIMVTLGSLLADLLYAWADPRLRTH